MFGRIAAGHTAKAAKKLFRFNSVALTAVVYLLWLGLDRVLPRSGDLYSYGLVMQFAALMLPLSAYYSLRGSSLSDSMRIRFFPLSKTVLLLLFAAAVFCVNVLFGMLSGEGQGIVLASVPAEDGMVAVLSVAVFPALSEELLFRGALLAELEENGPVAAVTVSSLLFAMFHFSPERLVATFFSGVLLSLCVYVTRSLAASCTVHLVYNLAVLLGAERINAFFSVTDERALIAVFLTVVLLICLILIFGECQRTYALFAEQNAPSSYAVRGGLGALVSTLFSPACALCIIIFIAALLL